VRTRIILGVGGLVVVAAILVAGLAPRFVWGVDGDTIGNSVAGGVGAPGDGDCTKQRDRDWWLCHVEDDPGSGTSRSFYVTADDEGCWEAFRYRLTVTRWTSPRRGTPALVEVEPGEQVASGCPSLGDYPPDINLFSGVSVPGQLPLAGSERSAERCSEAEAKLPPAPSDLYCGGDPLAVRGGVPVRKGRVGGRPWALTAFGSAREPCFRLTFADATTEGCYSLRFFRRGKGADVLHIGPVHAVVVSQTAAADVVLDTGKVTAVPLKAPGRPSIPGHFRFGVAGIAPNAQGILVVYDSPRKTRVLRNFPLRSGAATTG
jgi:hypothetical protein